MRTLRRTFSAMRPWEKWLTGVFTTLLMISFALLLRQFYVENTESIPRRGGTYIEGSVGTIRMLNPWFTVTNDVNRDITSLVFSGLQRYNPFTGKVEDDMATLEIGGNNRIYELTLRNDLFWHDSTEELPRPVTADDVVFTFQAIQKQGFLNPILQKNFRGVDIVKIDDRTVQFRLEKPYSFFQSNLTLGILPKRHLENIPADRLLEALDFNLNPVGSGPFKFKSMVEAALSTEVTLERFDRFYGGKPYIDRIVFRAFPDYPSLLSDLPNLDGVRHVPRNKEGKAIIPRRYRTHYYSLPQYVALFFNMDREVLKDETLRLALQLATNKRDIVKTINETVIVDTPLLEFAKKDWQYRFEPGAAQGALFDSDWHLPEKVRLQHLLINRDRNFTGALALPQSVVLLSTGAQLTITGSYVEDAEPPLFVNAIEVQTMEGTTATGTWIVNLPTDGGSGSILPGENWIRLTETGGGILDTFILTRVTDTIGLRKFREEQKIVELYRRKGTGITIADLKMEQGTLTMKKEGELHGIRLNDDGEELKLRLLTSPLPPTYPKVAEVVAQQWRKIGVNVVVEVPQEKREFENRVIRRDYDVLLFGQPLLDNLDSYPYWHSSQIQIFADQNGEAGPDELRLRLDANNLSQFTSFRADALLEQIRETHITDLRQKALDDLRTLFRETVPAVVLYSPTYVFAMSEDILGVDLGKPSLHSDRFLSMHRWFIKRGRSFRPGIGWFDFFPWLKAVWGPPP
jgi:ABC-type transport system substrate-binding protein